MTDDIATIETSTKFSDTVLSAIESWDAGLALGATEFGPTADASDILGNGFTVLPNKEALIGRTLLILDWTWRSSNVSSTPYVSMVVLAKHTTGPGVDKFIVNDGGTGIPRQLKALEEQGIYGNVGVKAGLRKSVYISEATDNEATTWYLAV